MKIKYYAGIGSRKTPSNVLDRIRNYSRELGELGYHLNTGDAIGADAAFIRGTTLAGSPKTILKSNDALPWSFIEVQRHLPSDRRGFENWKPFIKGLVARDMMQVLGTNGDEPVEFVLCYTPTTEYSCSLSGGTGYAIRCALAYDIPVYNLFIQEDEEKFIKERLNRLL